MKFLTSELSYSFTLLAMTVGFAGVGLFSIETSEKLFLSNALFFMLVCFSWWIFGVIRSWKNNHYFLRKNAKAIGKSFGIGLLLSGFVFSTNTVEFKTNSDETNLLSLSRSISVLKEPYNVTMGKNYFGNFNPIRKEIPKRPLMFSSIVSIFHSTLGFSHYHPFILNFILLAICLSLCIFIAAYLHSWLLGVGLGILLISNPVLPIFATSGGFDLASGTFMLFSFLCFLYIDKDRSDIHLFLGTLAVFSFIRYESVLVAGLLILFYFLRKKRWPGRGELLPLSFFSFLMIPHVWQIIFSRGKYENPDGLSVLSPTNLINNFPIFLKGIVDFNLELPYATLPILLGVVSLLFLSLKRKINLGIIVCLATNLLIFLCHHAGKYDHPTQARFFLPFTSAMILFIPIFANEFLSRLRAGFFIISLSILSLLIYHPIATQDRFINNLILNRELRVIYDLVEKYQTKNILIVHPRPGQFAAMEYGAVDLEYAKKNWNHLTLELERGLFQKIILVEEKLYKLTSPTWFKSKSKLKTVHRFQKTANSYVEVSEVVNN